MRTGRTFFAATLLLIASASFAGAQTTAVVPSQFATAKTMFLGFEGGNIIALSNRQALDALEQALIQEHRYTIVRSPGEAELSARIWLEGTTIKLSVYDTRSGMLLWTVITTFPNGFAKNQQNKLAKAADDITAQLEELAAGKVPEYQR